MSGDLGEATALELAEAEPIRLDRATGLLRLLLGVARAAVTRGQGRVDGHVFPALSVSREGVVVPARRVAAYRGVCGLPGDDAVLPLPLPEILFLDLLGGLVTDPRFPLSPLGLIHVRQTLDGASPLRAGTPLDLGARIAAARRGPKGIELDVDLVVRSRGVEAWRATTTLLSRSAAVRARRVRGDRETFRREGGVDVVVPEDTGRRYARVSGDVNPHHLWAFTARPLGYPRPIAHGMWELARLLGEVPPRVDTAVGRVDAGFKVPLPLPGTMRASVVADDDGWSLDAWHPSTGAPFVEGRFRPGS